MSQIAVAWLLTYLAHSSILLGLAWAAERAGWLKRPRLAETVWRIALCGGLTSASAQALLPLLDAHLAPWLTVLLPAPLNEATALLACLWLVPALLAVLHIGANVLALNRSVDSVPAGAHQELAAFLARLCGSLGRPLPPLRIDDRWSSPVVLPNGAICVPRWVVDTLSPPQREAVLAHEMAHVLRRDAAWRIAGKLIARIGFLQPLNGLAIRRLDLLAELSCDDWAARHAGRRDLADALYLCAGTLRTQRVPDLAPAMAAPRSPLMLRIVTLLEGGASFVPPRLRGLSILLSGGLMLLAAAATLPAVAINIDHASSQVSIDGQRFSSRLDGEMAFSAAEDTVVRVTKPLRIVEVIDGARWRIDVLPGHTSTSYSIDGAERPLDGAGRAWLARVIPHMLRETGWEASARVARLLAQGGEARLLTELQGIQTPFARATYARAYLAQAQLTGDQLTRLFALAPADELLRSQVLIAALRSQSLDRQQLTGVMAELPRMRDGHTICQVLLAVAAVMPADQDLLRQYRQVAKNCGPSWRGQAEQALDHLLI